MCLEKRTGWMDSSNAVVLNESLTLLLLPQGEGMWTGRARPHFPSARVRQSVSWKTGQAYVGATHVATCKVVQN